MNTQTHLPLPGMVALSVLSVVAWAAIRPSTMSYPEAKTAAGQDVVLTADSVDTLLRSRWDAESIRSAQRAEDLQVFRRLTLALVGTVPSLEEIRQFEDEPSADRLQRWTTRLIADSRFIEYFAARLADVYVDPAAENLKPHQRERFVHWLGSAIQRGDSYGDIVRQLIADRGVYADHPAATFVAVELSLGDQAAERLAARTARSFLGQRIDCAQCHDHPFAQWTQPQFEALAAYYGQVQFRSARVQDTRPRPFVITDERRQQERTVAPDVPFDSQWASDNRHLRTELAAWLTHAQNRRFRRAIANRVWGLMFGRPYVSPVDDLPDPPLPQDSDLLDRLADDLLDHDDDLRRLIHVIVATLPFHLASTHDGLDNESFAEHLEDSWAVFPLDELGSQQMVRSMQQAASVATLRAESSNPYSSIRRYERQDRFVQDYGVAGDSESGQASTIPHTVQRLSGNYTRGFSRASLLTAPGRIAAISADPASCLENCYLACLTRRPTPDEQAHFLPQFEGQLKRRVTAVEDTYWTMFNSAEFCWNH